MAIPSPGSTLAEGVVVEANVLARLLGARLLRLEAHVVLTPAPVVAPRAAVVPGRTTCVGPAAVGNLADAVRLLEQASTTLNATRPHR